MEAIEQTVDSAKLTFIILINFPSIIDSNTSLQ